MGVEFLKLDGFITHHRFEAARTFAFKACVQLALHQDALLRAAQAEPAEQIVQINIIREADDRNV